MSGQGNPRPAAHADAAEWAAHLGLPLVLAPVLELMCQARNAGAKRWALDRWADELAPVLAALEAAGYAVVRLPEPAGRALPDHDGHPGELPYWLTAAEERLFAQDADGLLYDGPTYDGTDPGEVAEMLEHDALTMLAAARWLTSREDGR